jgi:hypothetical protein
VLDHCSCAQDGICFKEGLRLDGELESEKGDDCIALPHYLTLGQCDVFEHYKPGTREKYFDLL